MTTQTIKVLMIAQKNKPNADGKVPIFARITVGKESRVISTKLWIAPERWGNGKARGNLKEDFEVCQGAAAIILGECN